MRIDMGKVFAVLDQAEPDVLAIDSVDYALKRFSVLEVASMQSLTATAPGETAVEHLARLLNGVRSMFDGPVPPFLDVVVPDETAAAALDVDRMLATVASVMSLVIDSARRRAAAGDDLGNKLARVTAETRRQIEAARANG